VVAIARNAEALAEVETDDVLTEGEEEAEPGS